MTPTGRALAGLLLGVDLEPLETLGGGRHGARRDAATDHTAPETPPAPIPCDPDGLCVGCGERPVSDPGDTCAECRAAEGDYRRDE